MTPTRQYPGSVMVLYCVVLHIIWAALVISDPATTSATPVAVLSHIFISDAALFSILIVASCMSLIGLFSHLPWTVVLMIPQQSLLLISAFGAIGAIVSGQFADGVVRPQAFIAADQAHIILAAICHALAIIASTYERVART